MPVTRCNEGRWSGRDVGRRGGPGQQEGMQGRHAVIFFLVINSSKRKRRLKENQTHHDEGTQESITNKHCALTAGSPEGLLSLKESLRQRREEETMQKRSKGTKSRVLPEKEPEDPANVKPMVKATSFTYTQARRAIRASCFGQGEVKIIQMTSTI